MSRTCMLAFAALLIAGCGSRGTSNENAAVDSSSAMNQRQADEGSAEAKLARLGARIDSLKTELDRAGVQGKAELEQEIADLQAKQKTAEIRLAQLKDSSSVEWSRAKSQMATMLDELDQKLDRLRVKIQEKLRS